MHRVSTATVFALFALTACAEPPLTSEPVGLTRFGGTAANFASDGSDSYLVRFKGQIPADFSAQVAKLGGEVIFAHAGVGIAAVAGIGDAGAATLAAHSGIAAVDPDAYTEQESVLASDATEVATSPESPDAPNLAFFFPRQWNHAAVGSAAAWAAGKRGNANVKVGILDTGIDYLHPDLVGRVDLELSRSFLSAAENARVPAGAHLVADLNYHGTHVASTVASNGYINAGVSSNVTLVGLKVCAPGTAANGFRGTCPTSGTLAAILFAADNGLHVINLSLGGTFLRRQASAAGGFGPSFLATINQVFNYAKTHGTTVVVSAGNSALDIDHDGNGYKSYCSASAVICASATGPTDARRNAAGTAFVLVGGAYQDIQNIDALAGYSNYGRSAISVAAPGGNVLPVWQSCSGFTIHTGLTGCRTRFYTSPTSWSGSTVGVSGTSMAAPHVTGLAALIAGEVGRSPAQIMARLQQTADDLGQVGTDPAYGKGRINVARAMGVN
ncbi:MAG TPA: S8 family serine peptidase [Gemmatimonadaceae bacterium]|nr:S8 family serine peptidase [Gemmatimonadaceae bacterium]